MPKFPDPPTASTAKTYTAALTVPNPCASHFMPVLVNHGGSWISMNFCLPLLFFAGGKWFAAALVRGRRIIGSVDLVVLAIRKPGLDGDGSGIDDFGGALVREREVAGAGAVTRGAMVVWGPKGSSAEVFLDKRRGLLLEPRN